MAIHSCKKIKIDKNNQYHKYFYNRDFFKIIDTRLLPCEGVPCQ